MGFAGYVSVCLQLYCVGFHCLSLHVSAYVVYISHVTHTHKKQSINQGTATLGEKRHSEKEEHPNTSFF
jgi:hypothetical protein